MYVYYVHLIIYTTYTTIVINEVYIYIPYAYIHPIYMYNPIYSFIHSFLYYFLLFIVAYILICIHCYSIYTIPFN